MHQSKVLSLRNHLDGQKLRQVIHPQAWSLVYLRALKITLVKGVIGRSFIDGAPDAILEESELIELLEGILGVEKPYGNVDNRRTALIDFIVALGVNLETCGPRRHAEKFVGAPLRASLDVTPIHLWLRFFNPSIAVCTPSRLRGNPNYQVVGYLLAIAHKYFRIRPERAKERQYLVRLDSDSRAYFARTLVTWKYLDTLENGNIAEDEEGFEMEISEVYDLKDTYQRAAFVAALTCVYAKILKYENL
ncbi:hypothetical protein L873DRAFT_1844198 [Choiromyces venosus 120613-1]|uniref:Uncharacterized protein n=1 Tax=Choiromyces venosus 120613-1 TaxID=1336337 RepID=A0A3N4JJR6_9PEZI|nr:hypothetical protein L873DRAFT_1844198 [Choiromyces venosus 120613-1]